VFVLFFGGKEKYAKESHRKKASIFPEGATMSDSTTVLLG